MLRNEILSHIPDEQLESSKLSLTFDKDFLEKMKLKYDATPKDLFSATDIFAFFILFFAKVDNQGE